MRTHRQLHRRDAARALRIDIPNGIDESGFVTIGSIDQWSRSAAMGQKSLVAWGFRGQAT
ncbi:hypothetical protein OG874_38560 [Nocardia sp. NBC_00565]|uniref:hypothetical protein n=1 Tax=Nocardia sp. NBC_00565 TaxID=2975993 RepID=UPI002E817763|nr:hypothetical protein [Nocardia sp. NBC_00565]WUC02554.1 hypothetical protein OG874_38560 [Nocardia sp. NBC_00565]